MEESKKKIERNPNPLGESDKGQAIIIEESKAWKT